MMYLVSVYFDEKADKRIREYIRLAAKRSGNTFMIDENVPPHITVSAFEIVGQDSPRTDPERGALAGGIMTGVAKALTELEKCVRTLPKGTLQWVSVGTFMPGVIFLTPVLNRYLQQLSEAIYECLSGMEDVKISRFYRPYQWLPHTTVAKQLTKEEMKLAFGAMQESYGVFSGEVVRIGLAKTNPYEDIISWDV